MNHRHLRRVRARWSDGDGAAELRHQIATNQGPLTLVVVHRKRVEAGLTIGLRYALISVSNPGSPAPALPADSDRVALLTLHFHDSKHAPGDERLREHVRPITPDQAEQISRFVLDCLPRVEAFVVHCDHAMSRSPAVAAAISKALGDEGEFFHEHRLPNARVFELVCEALLRGLAE